MKSIEDINQIKREKRKKETAEVFTPEWMVEEMLNKMPGEIWQEDKTFIDSSCGNGNILVGVLNRKLDKGHDPHKALKTIFGLDIMQDNIRECRLRLLKVISLFDDITKEDIKIVTINVRWLNSKKWPNGSLDYDMSFRNNSNNKSIDEWYEKIQNGELELVDLPVEDNDVGPTVENGKVSNRGTESVDIFNKEDINNKEERD